MRLYLSSVIESFYNKDNVKELLEGANILHSFAYNKPGCSECYSYCKNLLLDSGAFTVMNSKKSRKTFSPMEYCKKYAEHINENNIEHFIELDIEGVYGFDVYRDCLHQLQDMTGKEPIYVFHKWRGLDYYRELVKKYDYIALGDVSVGGSSREIYKYFPWFIEEAHRNNCRVHGLAFTYVRDLNYMNFDSVDSSTWTMGVKYANPFRFNGHGVRRYYCKRNDVRQLAKNDVVKEHDYLEWKKLSQYYDTEFEPVW